jgi:hypothetical protein
MDEKYYTTPNGTIVGESTLRSKYGEKFDSFLSDGKITEVAETIYETPNGSLIQESVLKDKYGEKFNTFLSDGKLKKKEQTEPTQTVQAQQKAPTQAAPLPGLGGVSEEPTQSPSVGQALPSTGNNTLDNIYQKYSALRSMGKVTLKADPNFTRDKTGAGSIEYFSPKQDTVRYGTGLKTPHPKLGTHGIVYNPNENTEEDIMLDMLHGMTSDKEYSRLRDKFKEQTISDRGGDIKYFYEKDKKEGRARDGYEQWLDNYVDGLIRSEISTATQGDYALEREGNTPNMKSIASEIDSYLKTGLPRPPSPSVGQGVLRNVDQTQPRGEAFISRASDLTRTDVREPQVDGEELPTGPAGPTGPTGADGQGDIVPEIDYETMGIGETPTGAPISMDDPYIRQQDELRKQARDNNYQFGIDEPDEFLPNYTAVGIPENVKDVDVKDYLSGQIGEVQRRVNQVMSNPEAYGFPQRILSATEEDIQELTNEIYKQSAPASTYNRGRGGLVPLPIESQRENFINLDESYFRNVVKNAVNNYKSRYEVEKNERILTETTSDYIKAGYEKEKIRGVIFGELSNQEKFDQEEKKLYDINNQLRTLRGQLSSLTPDSPKYSEVQQKYNGLILSADDARKKLGDDREALYDTRTGERVDKIDSPNTSDLTLQIQDEMDQLTFEEDIQDVYIKAGLADNEHRSYGQKAKFDIEIPLTRTGKTDRLMHGQAIDGLKMLGYQSSPVLDEDGNQTNRISFKDVSLSDISNSYVRQAVRKTNEKLAEDSERWHDRNVDLMVKRIAARNMSLLNIDPGKIKKEQFSALGIDFYPTRMLEVIGEEVLPKGITEEIGISDVKLVDNAIPQLEAHGIELTEAQKENAKRGIDLEVQEGVATFVPVMAEIAILNKGAGTLKAVSGLKKIYDTYKNGTKFERGIAILIDAGIEEAVMQGAGMNTGAGASFSILGNRFRKYGLDKFPLRFKGELARLNKLGDNLWGNALTGTITMEAAGIIEAAIEDFSGGETIQNYIEQNYSDLSEVGKRQLVNSIVFNVIGAKGLIGKGQSGFRIRKMEEARDEMRSKGYTQEAERLDSYIKDYYDGKKTSWEVQLTPEEKSAIRNRMARAGETGDVEIQEWFSKNPQEGKKVLKKGVVSVGTFDKIKSLFGIRPEIIRDLSESKVEKVGENYEVKLLTDGKEVGSYKTESKEEAEAVSNEINADLKEKESVGETAPTVIEPTGDTVPAKQKGRLTKFSTPQDGIVGELTYEDGTKKELTQEEYDALEKQEGLFDVETGTQPVAETPVEETVSAPTEVAEEAAPKELSPKQKEAYNGLTKEEKQAVDELIFDEQYELSIGAKDVEKPKYLTKEESAIWDYEDKIAKESINYEDALNNALGIVSEKQKADGEVFTFGQDKYNIDKAVNLANTEGIEPIEIGIETTPKLRMPFVLKTEEGIENADLSKPVIIATTKDGLMLIDGHHRLEKAIREGKPVKAQILSESQTLKIKQETVPAEAKEAAIAEPISEASLEDGRVEITNVKSGTHTSTKPIKIFKGIGGKKDLKGARINAHKGAEGFFTAVDKNLAEDYARGGGVSETVLPEGTTFEVVEIDGTGMTPGQYRDAEVKAINESKADVVKLITVDGKIKAGTKKQEQYVIKNEKLIEDAVQKQAAGKVPVQPEAKAGEKVEEGKPKTEAEKPTQEGKEVLSEEDAKSEEKVKEVVEKQMSDEKKNEEADKEIESKSEEELKEDVPDVLESISETEREKLDREAKFKGKSTVDYVIDYLKGKLKNVRQSIKNILDKIKSSYRKTIIGTTIIIDLATMGTGVKLAEPVVKDTFKEAIEFASPIVKEVSKSNILSFAESNKELFSSINETVQSSSLSESIKGDFANVASQSGAVKGVKQEVSLTKQGITKETDVIDDKFLDSQTFNENIGDSREATTGITQVRYREQYPASRGSEFVLIGSNQERKGKDIEGVERISHFMLDGNFKEGVDYTDKDYKYFKSGDVYRYADNRGNHKTGVETDGYVPYILKKSGDRAIVTYKRYSEISKSKDVNEVLKDKNILTPLRQFKFGEIDWDRKPIDKEVDKGGDRVYQSAVELLLKDGVPNPYREGRTKGDGGGKKDLHPRGTYIFYTPASGEDAYGRYNGGSFVFIFDYKGETFIRDFAGSITDVKAEGRDIAKKYGISENDITIGFHDAGSVSTKPKATNGKIADKTVKKVNSKGIVTSALGKPTENKIPRDKPTEGETPIGLMALPLLFGGVKRKRKPLEDTDADKVVTDWMEDVQKIYDAQKTKDKQEAVNEAATNLALSGRLNEIAPDQRLKVLEDIAKQTAAMDEKKSVSITSELQGLTLKEQFKQGFEEYVAALKNKEASKKLKAEIKLKERIDKLKEKAKEAVQKAKDDVDARKVFNEIIKAEMKELGLGTLKRSEVTRLLSMAKNADKKKVEELIENGINLMVKAAKKNLKTAAEASKKKLVERIKEGDFGTTDQKAIAIANIPVENIPVERLQQYYDLLDNLVSLKGKVSARDLNKLSEFIDSISEEIENKIGGVETLAELYDVFDSERKIESESQEYTEAKKLKKDERNARQQGLINRIEGKAKEEFKSFLEELGMPTEITDFANNEFEAIVKEHKRQNTEKGKPLTSAKKIEKIKEKRQQAIDNFNSLYPIEKGSRGIDVSLYKNNEVLAEAAAFFNKLGNNQLKDLFPSEINALPLIYENMNFGLMTSSVFRIMSKIKGSMTVDQMSESSSQFSRMLATSPKDLPGDVKTMAEDFTLPLYNLVKPETPTSVSIKDAKELGRRMLAEQTPYIKYLMKGIKGDPVYEMLNGLTGAMTSASSMVSDAKRKTYDLFMGMKGLPLENNMMISTFHRIREHQALKGETDITIRRPIEYVDAKIETARTDNQGIYDLMVGIKDKYFR